MWRVPYWFACGSTSRNIPATIFTKNIIAFLYALIALIKRNGLFSSAAVWTAQKE
jgi:hypothetical protein